MSLYQFSEVRSALVAAYQAAVGVDLYAATKWENVAFKPAALPVWCEFLFVANTPTVATCGDIGEDEATGYVQVNVYVPTGTGDGTAREISELLRNFFTSGKSFSYNNATVWVTGCGPGGGRETPSGHYCLSVTITWETRLDRNTT